MKKLLVALIYVAGLVGGATYFPHDAKEAYEKAKSYAVDKFTGKSKVVGEDYRSGDLGVYSAIYCYLFSDVDKNSVPTNSFVCRLESTDWYFLNTAHDSNQKVRSLNQIDRQVMSGSVREVVSIDLTNSEFMNGIQNGISFKLVGGRGDAVVSLPAFYFEGYANRLTEHLKYRLSLKQK